MTNIPLPFWSDPTGAWLIVDRHVLEGLGISPADLSCASTSNGDLVALLDGPDTSHFIAACCNRFGGVRLTPIVYDRAPPRDWPTYGQGTVTSEMRTPAQ